MQIQPGAAVTLATRMQDEVRAARMEVRAEKKVDEIVEGGELLTTVESKTADTEELPGVLRLLKEGHFRGVADVRLRIVHADKIAAMESEQVKANVTGSSELLTSSISSTVRELAEASDSISGEQAEAAIVTFEDQVNAAIDTSFASNAFDAGVFETTLQAAFQTLVDQLESGSTADDLTTEGIELSVGSDAITNESDEGSRDFLAELREIFSVELSRILEGAGSEMTLPPISEPNGSGRAFEKFLAMYNEIQNGDDVADESSKIETDA